MLAKQRSKMVTVMLLILTVVAMACSSALTVFAEELPQTLNDYLLANNQKVVDSGILESENLFADLKSNSDEDLGLKVAKKIVSIVDLRETEKVNYSDEALAEKAEPARVGELKSIRDQAFAAKISNAVLLEGASDYLATFQSTFTQTLARIDALIEEDAAAFEALASSKAGEVKTEYDRLLTVNTMNNVGMDGREYTTVGFYAPEYLAKLNEVYASLVKLENGELHFVDPVAYVAKDVVACKTALDELTESAKKTLKAVPHNDIEAAYQGYNDYLGMEITETQLEEIKSLANKAIKAYEKSSTSEAIKTEYSDEYKVLKGFVEAPFEHFKSVKVSTVKDAKNVLVITAKYASGSNKGQIAEVLPENLLIEIYSTANSSPKRNVTVALKDIENLNKELSVAYHLAIRIRLGGYKNFELPTRDEETGAKLEYEVRFDLAAYYSKYCEAQGFEKDKIQNITDANDLVSKIEGASICYGYNNGVTEALNYTLEGGVLMFTTTSNLSNLCVAGTGLDSIFTNPWFWVIAVAALIVLIIVIRIIVKHVRYSIKFITNGGSAVPNVRAAKGEYFVMPADPVKEGYVFAGWYTDKNLTDRFVGVCMRKRKGFKLYAKWVSPIASGRLIEMYDTLRDLFRSYEKVSFKPLLGLTENEAVAMMYFKENHIQLNLALNPDVLKKEGISVKVSKEKKFAEVPTQLLISTEEIFATALELVRRVLLAKGLQKVEDYEPGAPSTAEERSNGFAYMIKNERVASTAEDYFEMLRLALKAYVMEEDNGMFKPGDKVTLARIYITNEVACLHLPTVKGNKLLKPARDARFEDTPVMIKILAPRDMLEAYALIDEVMKANGLVKNPENANDLADVKVPATNGFAYTLVF